MLVVEMVLAAGMFTGLMVVADRFATRWTTEDPITVAECRHARRSRRRSVRHSRNRRPARLTARLRAAYDGVLVEAAEKLELHQELAAQPPGLARDIERVRVQAALEDAGLTVRD